MKNKRINPVLSRVLPLLLILAIFSASLGGCGIIVINGGGEDTSATAATTVPETEEAPETTLPEDTAADTAPSTDTGEATEEVTEETVPIKPVVFPSRRDEAESRLDSLIDTIDISDFDIIIVTVSDTVDVLFSKEGDPLYAARSNRNTMLYEKYGVDVKTIYSEAVDTEKLYADLSTATSADVDYYLDLITVPANRAGKFLAKGLLKDMRTLPFYDTRSGNLAGNVGNMRYFDLGAGTDAPELIYTVFFNRTAIGTESTKALYSASLDGTLGFEDMLLAARNAEGREADISVTGNDNTLLSRKAADLLGIDFITKDKQGVPKLSVSDESILALDSYAADAASLTYYTLPEGGVTALEAFIEGRVPFYLGTLADIALLYDKPVEWGLLTLPSDKGLGAIADNRPVICLPQINSRLEQTSLWLSGFNAASGEWIRDQFLAVSIENHLRDNNSCLVLNKILLQDTVLGFSTVYSEYYSSLAEATYLAVGSGDYGAVYKSKLTALNKLLAKLPQ
jgi:hypothetical protein